MSQSERLKIFINTIFETPKSFSDAIGLSSPTTIYDIIAGKREITPSVLKKISVTYPDLNADWLLNGTGEMHTTLSTASILKLQDKEEPYLKQCLLCKEKERTIKLLQERVEDLKKTISSQEDCLNTLRALGGGRSKAGSG
jgi:DNA-directed RNA polymerase subunit M/transcription elongation factor TFIIS